MNWRNIKLIFLREVRDQLRDRRTLFMVAVLPLLLYPALGIGMVQLTLLFSEQSRTVVMLGSQHLPPPRLVQDGHFLPHWFRNQADATKLRVVTDAPQPEQADGRKSPEQQKTELLLQHARKVREQLLQQRALEQSFIQAEQDVVSSREKLAHAAPGSDAARVGEIALREAQERLQNQLTTLQQSRDEISQSFASSELQAIVIVPNDFKNRIEELSRRLQRSAGKSPPTDGTPAPHLEILYNKADDKSLITYNRVSNVLELWEQAIVKSQLELADLPAELPHPVEPVSVDLATESQSAASLWAKMFPAMLIIMSVTGAFYPAIDMCAGEKERGTMETLLICPASRTEIVLGKFFAIMGFSSATALLNLLSMGLTGQHMLTMAPRGLIERTSDLSLPTFPAMFWIVILLIPLSSLFSALSLAFATFARSSKEGQYYLTPLLMITLGLTVFCLSPGVELKPIYSVTPVVGVALLLKGVLLAPLNAGALYWYAIPVLLTSFAYSALALWWAIDQFNREEVLFREAERFDVSLWVRHLLRDKESTPSFTEAGFCFVMIMLLQFVAMKAFASASLNLSEFGGPFPPALRALLIQQLAIIAAPALIMGIMLTTSVRQTFRLYMPDLKVLGAALLLPFVLHPLALELQESLQWFFEPLRDDIVGVLKIIADPNLPLSTELLVFAFAPAVCEELAFRGFILSGFARRHRLWLAIVLSSVAFGGMHLIPQQVFNASLLGLVLGSIALRGNSLLPCILFHFLNNALVVLHGRWASSITDVPPAWQLLIHSHGGSMRYTGITLAICALIAAPLLVWLVKGVRREDRRSQPEGNPPAAAGRELPVRPTATV